MSRPINAKDILPEVKGMFSLDILVRHALLAGLKDLRENPWQLQLVFASLLDDPLTANLYGDKTRQQAIDWFLKTNIPVVFNYRLDPKVLPCISFTLMEGAEANQTMADTHYLTKQEVKAEWEPLTDKFTAAYETNGRVTLPTLSVAPTVNMVLVDGTGQEWPILEVIEPTIVRIRDGVVTDFSNSYLKWATNRVVADLGSIWFKETVKISSNINGDSEVLNWLHCITLYCLLRYKKEYIEGRGFEISSLSYGPIVTSADFFGTENALSRVINMTGQHKNYWAQLTSEKVTNAGWAPAVPSVDVDGTPNGNSPEGLLVGNSLQTTDAFKADPSINDMSWLAQGSF